MNNTVNEDVNQNQTTLEKYTHNYNITNNENHLNKGEVIDGDKNTLSQYVNASGAK